MASLKKCKIARKLDFDSSSSTISEDSENILKPWKTVKHGRSSESLMFEVDSTYKLLKPHRRKSDSDQKTFFDTDQESVVKKLAESKKYDIFNNLPPFLATHSNPKFGGEVGKPSPKMCASSKSRLRVGKRNSFVNNSKNSGGNEARTKGETPSSSERQVVGGKCKEGYQEVEKSPRKTRVHFLMTPRKISEPSEKNVPENTPTVSTGKFFVTDCRNLKNASVCGLSPNLKFGQNKWKESAINESTRLPNLNENEAHCVRKSNSIENDEKVTNHQNFEQSQNSCQVPNHRGNLAGEAAKSSPKRNYDPRLLTGSQESPNFVGETPRRKSAKRKRYRIDKKEANNPSHHISTHFPGKANKSGKIVEIEPENRHEENPILSSPSYIASTSSQNKPKRRKFSKIVFKPNLVTPKKTHSVLKTTGIDYSNRLISSSSTPVNIQLSPVISTIMKSRHGHSKTDKTNSPKILKSGYGPTPLIGKNYGQKNVSILSKKSIPPLVEGVDTLLNVEVSPNISTKMKPKRKTPMTPKISPPEEVASDTQNLGGAVKESVRSFSVVKRLFSEKDPSEKIENLASKSPILEDSQDVIIPASFIPQKNRFFLKKIRKKSKISTEVMADLEQKPRTFCENPGKEQNTHQALSGSRKNSPLLETCPNFRTTPESPSSDFIEGTERLVTPSKKKRCLRQNSNLLFGNISTKRSPARSPNSDIIEETERNVTTLMKKRYLQDLVACNNSNPQLCTNILVEISPGRFSNSDFIEETERQVTPLKKKRPTNVNQKISEDCVLSLGEENDLQVKSFNISRILGPICMENTPKKSANFVKERTKQILMKRSSNPSYRLPMQNLQLSPEIRTKKIPRTIETVNLSVIEETEEPLNLSKNNSVIIIEDAKKINLSAVCGPETEESMNFSENHSPIIVDEANKITLPPVCGPETEELMNFLKNNSPIIVEEAEKINLPPVCGPEIEELMNFSKNHSPIIVKDAKKITLPPVCVPETDELMNFLKNNSPIIVEKAKKITLPPVCVPETDELMNFLKNNSPIIVEEAKKINLPPVCVPETEELMNFSKNHSPIIVEDAKKINLPLVDGPYETIQLSPLLSTKRNPETLNPFIVPNIRTYPISKGEVKKDCRDSVKCPEVTEEAVENVTSRKSPRIFKMRPKPKMSHAALDTQAIDEFNTETLHLAPITKGQGWNSEGKISEILSDELSRKLKAVGDDLDLIIDLPKKKKRPIRKKSLRAEREAIRRTFSSERHVRSYELQKAAGDLPGLKEFHVVKIWGRSPRRVRALTDEGEAVLIFGKGILKNRGAIYPGCKIQIFPPWDLIKGREGNPTTYHSIRAFQVSFATLPQDDEKGALQEIAPEAYQEDADQIVRLLLHLPQPVPGLLE